MDKTARGTSTTLEPCVLSGTSSAEPTTTESTKATYTTGTGPTTAELTACSTTSGTYGARHRAIELTADAAISDGEDEDGGTDSDNSNV